jgi:SmpA/OmlA family protein
MKTRLVAAALVLSAACAGTPFQWEDTAKVRNGMTEQEVTAILGKPYSRSQNGNVTILTWSYAQAGSTAKAVSYRLENGRVVGLATVGK